MVELSIVVRPYAYTPPAPVLPVGTTVLPLMVERTISRLPKLMSLNTPAAKPPTLPLMVVSSMRVLPELRFQMPPAEEEGLLATLSRMVEWLIKTSAPPNRYTPAAAL